MLRLSPQFRTVSSAGEVILPGGFFGSGWDNRAQDMKTTFHIHRWGGFSFVEAIFSIAIIGIMSSLVVGAISNASRDAHRVIARQQQASVQSALTAWVMAQTRLAGTSQIRSLESVRISYNALGTTLARFNLLVPNPSSPDTNLRAGFLDQTTADHFLDYTSNSDRLKTAALENARQYLTLPGWQSGDFPRVDLVNE